MIGRISDQYLETWTSQRKGKGKEPFIQRKHVERISAQFDGFSIPRKE